MTLNDVINFIKSNFKEVNNNSVNLQNFKKLIEFLNKNNITLSMDDCSSLLQLKSFKNAITLISNDTDLDRILSDSEEDSIKNFYINLKICLDNELIDNIQGNDIIRDYLMQIKKIPMLSEEEKKTLPPLIKQGDEKAINRYVEANLRLVVSVAKRYKDKGYPFMDLIGEGNIGLIKAVKNFDYDKGFAFSTYAYQCIRVSIFSYMSDQYTLFKISKDTISDLMKLKKAADKTNLILDLNNKESINKLSKETGFESSYIEFLIKLELTNTISLDSYIDSSDKDSHKLIDMIPDEETDFDLNPFLKDFSQDFDKSSLKDKYKEVLKLRTGFYGKCYSLKEIGKMLNMSTEAVRNREIKALRLARHNENITKYSSNGKW